MSYPRTILNSLITTFTPPPECSVYGYYDTTQTGVFFQAQSCSGGLADAASCWPPVTVTTPHPNLNGFGFYSPGLHCPIGYYTACSAALLSNGSPSPISSPFTFQFPLSPGETAIGCCPSGMFCNLKDTQTCISVIRKGVITAGLCDSGGPDYSTIGSLTFDVSASSSATASAVLFAPLIQIVHKSQDLPAAATSTSTSAISNQIPSPTSSPSTQDGGLSSGAKIGLGVGIPLAVLLIAGLGALLFFSRRRKHCHDLPVNLPEFPAQHKSRPYTQPGLSNQAPVEVHANHKQQNLYNSPRYGGAAELDNTTWHRTAELPGGNEGR